MEIKTLDIDCGGFENSRRQGHAVNCIKNITKSDANTLQKDHGDPALGRACTGSTPSIESGSDCLTV